MKLGPQSAARPFGLATALNLALMTASADFCRIEPWSCVVIVVMEVERNVDEQLQSV